MRGVPELIIIIISSIIIIRVSHKNSIIMKPEMQAHNASL